MEDDGPIIPTRERQVVTGAAEIDQFDHGSGLGLWLTEWTTQQLGGELSFESSQLGGTLVRIRLQAGE